MLPANVTHSLPILLCCIIPSHFPYSHFPPSRPPQPQFSVSLINYSTLTPSSFLYLLFLLLIFLFFVFWDHTPLSGNIIFCFCSFLFPFPCYSLLLFSQSDYTTTFFIFTPARPVSVIFWSLILFILLSSFFPNFFFCWDSLLLF